MHQGRQNVQSTQPTASDLTPSEPNNRFNLVFTKTITITGKISTDQTGRFPVTSSRGNKYIMILFNHDSNAILAEPLKLRSDAELVSATTKLHLYFSDRGLHAQFHMLDNECSTNMKSVLQKAKIKFQLVPPNLHRALIAKQAIGTFKDHFCDHDFPLHLWCRLLPQALVTLNLLLTSRINPCLSSEVQLNGSFDYNQTPLAPPGTETLIFEPLDKRGTFALYGLSSWYIGPALDHYRCHTLYVPKTHSE